MTDLPRVHGGVGGERVPMKKKFPETCDSTVEEKGHTHTHTHMQNWSLLSARGRYQNSPSQENVIERLGTEAGKG